MTNNDKVYHTLRELFYYKSRQRCTANRDDVFVANFRTGFLLLITTSLLTITTAISNHDGYHKFGDTRGFLPLIIVLHCRASVSSCHFDNHAFLLRFDNVYSASKIRFQLYLK